MLFILRPRRPQSRRSAGWYSTPAGVREVKGLLEKKSISRINAFERDLEKKLDRWTTAYQLALGLGMQHELVRVHRARMKVAIKVALHRLGYHSAKVGSKLITQWNQTYLTGRTKKGRAQRTVLHSRMIHILKEAGVPLRKFFTTLKEVEKELLRETS